MTTKVNVNANGKVGISLLLALALFLAAVLPVMCPRDAFAFNPDPDTPQLTHIEYFDNMEESAFIVSGKLSVDALDFDGSYYGSGEAMAEFWGRIGSGEWTLYDEFLVRHIADADGSFKTSIMLGGRDVATDLRMRLVYNHVDSSGNDVSVSSGWSAVMSTGAMESIHSPKATSWSDSSDWAYEELMMADSFGLIPFVLLDKDFTRPVTRAEFSAIIVCLFELHNQESVQYESKSVFSDCEDINVLKAHSLGLVNGVGGGRFDPDGNLTREQMATILWRAMLLFDPFVEEYIVGVPSYSDENSISSWAKDAVLNMGTLGYVKGTGGGKFDPGGVATREQAVLVSLRMYDFCQAINE